jgi:tRNA A58 N-methylase Trm61
LIVSLLDLHPSVPGTIDEKLEIFEAGTGHGALTMFLSRAVHGANTAPPKIPAADDEADINERYQEWLAARRAIVHTLDISERHSMHARKTVKNFRNGIYFSNIDFHVGTIEDYLTARLEQAGGEPFLDHAILDLPSTHLNMDIVSKALKPNGTLITFCPSITQVAVSLDLAKDEKLPLFLDSVIEIGGSVGVGGREWDVRRVQVRAQGANAQVLAVEDSEDIKSTSVEGADGDEERIVPVEPQVEEPRWEMVCRPRVGTRVVGGGFVGVWRKKA